MKRYLKPIVAVCLLLVLALILFARQAGANPLNLEAKGPLTFSGTLEARQTRIAPEVAARVNAVRVNKGDLVKVGDPLVQLDDAMLQSSLSEAESAARAALANLDQVKEPARSGAVALAEAGVAQAQAELKAAQAALDDANRTLQLPQDLLTQLHIWEGKVEASKGEVGQAEAILAGIKNQVELAQRDQSMGGKYAYAAMQKQQAAAEATLAAAQASQIGNARVLDLYRQMVKNPLDLIAAQHAAANQVKVAEAGLKVAQTELDIVRRPPQPEAVALAEAKLNAAQSYLKLVQAQARRYSITSPLDGTVIDRTIEPGETTRPGRAPMLKAFEDGYLKALDDAIMAQDSAKATDALNNAVTGCNACHAGSTGANWSSYGYVQIQLPPTDRIEVSEQINDVGVPTPPQIPGQCDAFLVQILRRKARRHGGLGMLRG